MKEFKDFPNKYTAYINDQDIRDFGALVESFKVGASPVTNHIYQGRNRTNFTEHRLHLLLGGIPPGAEREQVTPGRGADREA